MARENTNNAPSPQERIRITPDGGVKLRLPSGEIRFIGRVYGDTFTAYRRREHFFNKIPGWGLCYKLLSRLPELGVRYIAIETATGSRFETTARFFLANSDFLYFKKQGLERQKFLPLRLWGMECALAWERQEDANRASQPSPEWSSGNKKLQPPQPSLFDERSKAA